MAADEATGGAPIRRESHWQTAWLMFAANASALGGAFVLAIVVIVGLFGPLVLNANPFEMVAAPFTPPGENGLVMGSDYLGRDVFLTIVYGTRTTLAIGVSAAALTVLIGISVGAVAGFYGGTLDNLLMRVTEFFQVLPSLLFAMVLVTLFRPGVVTVIFAIGIVAWPATARLTRAEFLKLREREFVLAGRAAGASGARLMWRVILPNAMPPLIIAAVLVVSISILFEAALSFLGLNDPEVMTWGLMIGLSRNYIRDAWWAVTFPGLAILLTVLSLNLVGDGLNDALNPKLRQR